jgi:hypothetical protein
VLRTESQNRRWGERAWFRPDGILDQWESQHWFQASLRPWIGAFLRLIRPYRNVKPTAEKTETLHEREDPHQAVLDKLSRPLFRVKIFSNQNIQSFLGIFNWPYLGQMGVTSKPSELILSAEELAGILKAVGVRVQVDKRDHLSPGFKFNEWEVKGVPVRVEIGPRDLEANQAVVLRRDTLEKMTLSFDGLAERIPALLEEIQENLLKEAEGHLNSHMSEATTKEELIERLETLGGFVRVPWAGEEGDEKRLQEETKATLRVVDERELEKEMPCVLTGKMTKQAVWVARAY